MIVEDVLPRSLLPDKRHMREGLVRAAIAGFFLPEGDDTPFWR